MIKILWVRHNGTATSRLEGLLLDSGYRVVPAQSGGAALGRAGAERMDLALIENQPPDLDGLQLLKRIISVRPRMPVIMLSSKGDTEEVIEAAKLGAFDCLPLPVTDPEFLRVVEAALEAGRFTRSPISLAAVPGPTSGEALIGSSRPMREVYKAIGRVAPTDTTVLIRGESGTGKELVARAVYQHSQRKDRPFVIVNCVAIPENLLESELFGYEKGAFTGADQGRIGKIERAQGGTVFLDEIGDIPVSIQAKLLRLLQEKTIERIGGSRPIKVDVRVIAATNAALEEKIREGRFREDLYYRLNVVSLRLPSLRERPEDIPDLADYFMARFSHNLSVRNPGLTPEALERLKEREWQGNVRELANTIEKCLIFSKGRPVGAPEVASLLVQEGRKKTGPTGDLEELLSNWVQEALAQGRDNLLNELTDRLARLTIARALEVCQGNRSQAARMLGISRPTLLYRMEKYGLQTEKQS